MLIPNSICWFEIYVQDMERAKKFYSEVFQITLEPLQAPDGVDGQMCAFPGDMNSYGANGALIKMPDYDSGKGGTIIYFNCDDCAEEESRVEAAGGSVHQSKFSIGEYGNISMVYDTEGNLIGLHSQK